MSIDRFDNIGYINQALSYAESGVKNHQGSLNQELKDLVYGVLLAYNDIKNVCGDVDKAHPTIRKRVTKLYLRACPQVVKKTSQSATMTLARAEGSNQNSSLSTRTVTLVKDSAPTTITTPSTQVAEVKKPESDSFLGNPKETVLSGPGKQKGKKPALSSMDSSERKTGGSNVKPGSNLGKGSSSSRSGATHGTVPPSHFGDIGLKGVPNFGTNCFATSAYQMVKHNPALYEGIFNNDAFNLDPRFEALREFDKKYDSEKPLTKYDMQKVRSQCLQQFGIRSYGHQDAYEVLTLALFQYLPMTSTLQSTVRYTFTLPESQVDAALSQMENVTLVSQQTKSSFFPWSEAQVTVVVEKTLPVEHANSHSVSLMGVESGATLEAVLALDATEGRGNLEDAHRLAPGVRGQQVNKETTFTPGDAVTISLKRFNSSGYKIGTPINVPHGRVRLAEGNLHQIKGFIVHEGRSRTVGHYVEYQKIEDQWFLNNDSESTLITEKDAISAMKQAYVLFAERT